MAARSSFPITAGKWCSSIFGRPGADHVHWRSPGLSISSSSSNRGVSQLLASQWMMMDGTLLSRTSSEHKMNYRVLLGDDSVSQLYGGVEALPTSFVIDRDGRIASVHVGLAGKDEYLNEIQSLLGEKQAGLSRASVYSWPAALFITPNKISLRSDQPSKSMLSGAPLSARRSKWLCSLVFM